MVNSKGEKTEGGLVIHRRTREKRSLGLGKEGGQSQIWKVGIELGWAHILGDGKKEA